MANNIPYMEGSAIKYLCRWRDKGGIQDLHKAQHFIARLIEEAMKEHEAKNRTWFVRAWTLNGLLAGFEIDYDWNWINLNLVIIKITITKDPWKHAF
jgi:UDP-3-O-acyl-N-acetylglucosamine deacetylase